MKKLLTATFAVACAALATGCQAAAPTGTLTTQPAPAAAKRQLMAVEAAPAAPIVSWSFQFREEEGTDISQQKPIEQAPNGQGGVIRTAFANMIQGYWFTQLDATFNGEGELQWMGSRRFTYRVPAGRVLVLNRGMGQVNLDGISLGGFRYWNSERYEDDSIKAEWPLELVFGPGELLTLRVGQDATLHGYTGDPSMRGLTGGGAGAAAATPGK